MAPAEVSESDLLAYRDALHASTLRASPKGTWISIVGVWNAEAERSLDWPQVLIERAGRADTYTLPWTRFPPSLKDDVDRWLNRLGGDLFADEGPARPVKAGTLITRERQLRVVASALVAAGEPIEAVTSLAALVRPDSVKRALSYIRDRNDGVPTTHLTQLAQMLLSVARHHVKPPESEVRSLSTITGRLPKAGRGLKAKNRARLLTLRDPSSRAKLLHLPEALRRAAERQVKQPRQAAVTASLAVAIELLIVAPIRVGNLAALKLDTNVIRTGRRLYISIPDADVKNGVPLEFELPDHAEELLAWYLEDHRPSLAKEGATDLLLPTSNGRRRTSSYLGNQITQTVKKYTGLDVHPHLFRHFAAQIYLDQNPGGYDVMRRVLGHKAMETTVSAYAGMETPAAIRHFDETVARLRQETAAKGIGGRR